MTPARARATSIEQRIRLNRRGHMPVYLQLADQLRYLIGTSTFDVGARLPPARQLAQNLRINRNTVLNAYAALSEDGLIETRRGGGTVVVAPSRARGAEPNPHHDAALLSAVDVLVQRGHALGLGPDELAALVSSRVRLGDRGARPRVMFVECNPQSLDHLGGSIQRQFDIVVQPILLDALPTAARDGRLDEVDCVVSTFFHLSEVRRALRDQYDKELLAIGVRPHLSVLDELARLRHGAAVAVVYFGAPGDHFASDRLRRMTEAIEQAHVKGIHVKPLLLGSATSRATFDGLDAIVVRPENIAAVMSKIPPTVKTIEFVNDLDAASCQFLAEVFDDLRARGVVRPMRMAAATVRERRR